MRVVIGVFCFIGVAPIKPIGAMLGSDGKHYEMPETMLVKLPKLSASSYIIMDDRGHVLLRNLRQGIVYAGTMKDDNVEYVIGCVERYPNGEYSPLFPFVLLPFQPRGNKNKIKIRLEGNYAYKYVPILTGDILNHVFFNQYDPSLIRFFDIDFPKQRKPLEPEFPVQNTLGQGLADQASTSRGHSHRQTASRNQRPSVFFHH